MIIDEIEKAEKQFAKLQEQMLFEEGKIDGTFIEPIFIINPTHKGIIRDSGLNIDVIWSDLCEKDKIYAITDKKMCDHYRKGMFL